VTKLQDETTKLQQGAAGGDLDAVKAQARAVGGACKNCHDQYRAAPEPK
jgi:cytochrome c556